MIQTPDSLSHAADAQHTIGWYRDRLGKITGSCVGILMNAGCGTSFTKTGEAYLLSIASERMIPQSIVDDDDILAAYIDETNITSKAMRIGSEREQEARMLYAELRGTTVTEIGSTPHPTIEGFASSPDGIVASHNGVIEIKCPKPATYMEYLISIHTPADLLRVNPIYFWQCQSHMAVTGARWCDFIVYCPYNRCPIHILRIDRDEGIIEKLCARVSYALDYIARLMHPSCPSDRSPKSGGNMREPEGTISISCRDLNLLLDGIQKILPHYNADRSSIREIDSLRRFKSLVRKLHGRVSKENNTHSNISKQKLQENDKSRSC